MKKKLLILFLLIAATASLATCADSQETEPLVSTEPTTETSQPTESLIEPEAETALGAESEPVFETEPVIIEDLLTAPAFSSEKNTSAMVDEIALTAKASADVLTDEQSAQIIEAIRSAEHNFYNSPEDMETYMWYGYLLDYKYDDSDPRSELGTDLCQSIKYVYRTAESIEDSSTQENLSQIDQDLEALYAQFSIGTGNTSVEEATAQTEMQTESEAQTEYVEMVWIPNSGTKYHKDSSCSNMNSPREVPLEEAEQMGYTPCKKCY